MHPLRYLSVLGMFMNPASCIHKRSLAIVDHVTIIAILLDIIACYISFLGMCTNPLHHVFKSNHDMLPSLQYYQILFITIACWQMDGLRGGYLVCGRLEVY